MEQRAPSGIYKVRNLEAQNDAAARHHVVLGART